MNQRIPKNRKSIYGAIIFSLIFLFNPSISVIDILPDFIAYFIIAKAFGFAADCAPHFEEACAAFKKLGWLNFCKVFGLLLMVFAKKNNPADNDIIPLVTLAFSVCEMLLTVLAVKHLFNGLFYLGNRGDAIATITPFRVGKFTFNCESARNLTFLFAVLKCLIYFLPTPFMLTYTSASTLVKKADMFVFTLIFCNVIGIAVGILWLSVMIRYANGIKKEGQFFPTLEKLLSLNRGFDLEKKIRLRSILSTLTVFSVSSFFTLELSLVENYDVNMIPHFLFAGIMTLGIYKLSRFTPKSKSAPALISGTVYFAVSAAAYAVQTYFLTEYGYAAITANKAARKFYPAVTWLSVLEFLSFALFIYFVYKMLRSFILTHTGINENSIDEESNEDYFGTLLKKNTIFLIAALALGFIKLLSVILHGKVKYIYSDSGEELMGTVVSPAVEWIGLAVTILAFAYIGITLYFISTLKDEVKMRYEEL